MHINNLIKDYGRDLRKYSLDNVRFFGVDILEYALLGLSPLKIRHEDIMYTDLRDVQIPEDSELFQKILNKNLMYVKMPKKNYNEYNFKGVSIENTIFHKDSILPNDTELFQKIKDKNLSNTVLPVSDFSKYNFENVILKGTVIPCDALLPNTKDFLQKIKDKSIKKLKICSGNYSNWDFTGVDVNRVYFGENVILPKNKELLIKTKDASISTCVFINKDLSEYDFTDVSISYCTFKNCKFPKHNWVERLRYKSLAGCEFQNCDFGGAILINSCIRDMEIDRCMEIESNTDFFQHIQYKSIEGAKLPIADYSNHNFNGVKSSFCKFPFEAILPTTYSFFSDMETCENMSLTNNVIKNIHLYDLNSINLDLRPYRKFLTDTQVYILTKKYKNKIDKNEIII